MADIFREVDEDLRRERYEKLWKTYGSYVIALLVAVVLVTAGMVGWREYSEQRRTADGARFLNAAQMLADGRTAESAAAFAALAADGSGDYPVLARLQEAGALSAIGDTAAVAEIYEGLAADDGIDPLYRDLALVLLALHSLDEADPAALSDRLAPLLADDNPWRHSAREMTGLLALRAGDHERAKGMFADLSDDPITPPAMRQRATELLAALGG